MSGERNYTAADLRRLRELSDDEANNGPFLKGDPRSDEMNLLTNRCPDDGWLELADALDEIEALRASTEQRDFNLAVIRAGGPFEYRRLLEPLLLSFKQGNLSVRKVTQEAFAWATGQPIGEFVPPLDGDGADDRVGLKGGKG